MITRFMVQQRNRRILRQCGFNWLFNSSWSKWLIKTITKGRVLKPSLERTCLFGDQTCWCFTAWPHGIKHVCNLISVHTKKVFYNVWSQMFVVVKILSNTIKVFKRENVWSGNNVWSPNTPVWRGLRTKFDIPYPPSHLTHLKSTLLILKTCFN